VNQSGFGGKQGGAVEPEFLDLARAQILQHDVWRDPGSKV
jgi:hypothetical protein